MKFLFGEVLSFITDVAGNIADIVMGGTAGDQGASSHGKKRLATQATIVGRNGVYEADVDLVDGKPSLRTFGVQAIESLKGFDPIADTWFYIGNELNSIGVGNPGDIVTVIIAAGDNVTKFPAVSVPTTVVLNDDEDILANRIVANLNGNANFNLNFFARKIDDEAVTVHITAKKPGPQGARPGVGHFNVTTTGTTTVTIAWDNIVQRSKVTSLARDPSNPTLGILGISGTVTAGEGDVTGRLLMFARDNNGIGSDNLRVNGSVTPVAFFILPSTEKERFFTSLRFEALGNGIQFTKFLSQNGILTNGIEITIRSNNSEITFPLIKATEDFASLFSIGPSDFDIYDTAGTDYFRSTLSFPAPFQLFKAGTFATDDFIRIRIQDNLTSGLTDFKFIGFGFEREF